MVKGAVTACWRPIAAREALEQLNFATLEAYAAMSKVPG